MENLSNILQNLAGGEFGLTEFSISILFSIAAGIVCMLLYNLYFPNAYERNESLSRSFVLIAPSISAMFWAIQYSLPLSLGLLGALSFVRFRTPIKKPEDISFILLIIAVSLLSSVFRFFAAGILLGAVSLLILVKAQTTKPFLSFLRKGEVLTVFVSAGHDGIKQTDADVRNIMLREFGKSNTLVLHDVLQREEDCSLRYSFHLKKCDNSIVPGIFEALKSLQGVNKIEVFNDKNDS